MRFIYIKRRTCLEKVRTDKNDFTPGKVSPFTQVETKFLSFCKDHDVMGFVVPMC